MTEEPPAPLALSRNVDNAAEGEEAHLKHFATENGEIVAYTDEAKAVA